MVCHKLPWTISDDYCDPPAWRKYCYLLRCAEERSHVSPRLARWIRKARAGR
jgi:hypothetical protein